MIESDERDSFKHSALTTESACVLKPTDSASIYFRSLSTQASLYITITSCFMLQVSP